MGELVLAALLIGTASFRLWRIIARDQITEPFRAPIIARSDRQPWTWVLDLILCPWCLGFYITAVGTLTLGLMYHWHPVEGVLVWLAASAVCGFLGRADDKQPSPGSTLGGMETTPLGWPVLEPGSVYLYDWLIPGWGKRLRFRRGAVGFILCYILLFIHERVERLDEGHPADDWGHSKRRVTGGTAWSEHAGGNAGDFNATQHPYGVPVEKTFTPLQITRLRRKLRLLNTIALTLCVRWGGDYRTNPDGMHLEVACMGKIRVAKRVARLLMVTPRGRRILAANPSQRPYITS